MVLPAIKAESPTPEDVKLARNIQLLAKFAQSTPHLKTHFSAVGKDVIFIIILLVFYIKRGSFRGSLKSRFKLLPM